MEGAPRIEIWGLDFLAESRLEHHADRWGEELILRYRGAKYHANIENERRWWEEHGKLNSHLPDGDWTLGLHLEPAPDKYSSEVLLDEGVEHFTSFEDALASAILTVIALHGTPAGKWRCVRGGHPAAT